jgi:hypothetical protein
VAGRPISREVAGRSVPTIKGTSMKKLISLTMMGVLAMGLGIGISGCSEESSAEKKTTIKTPEGTSTTTEKTTVDQSGKNPPAPKGP